MSSTVPLLVLFGRPAGAGKSTLAPTHAPSASRCGTFAHSTATHHWAAGVRNSLLVRALLANFHQFHLEDKGGIRRDR